MRILITGSRDWPDAYSVELAIVETLSKHRLTWHEATIVQGDCPSGADRFAKDFAIRMGMSVESHPANWDRFGRRAGPIRNKEMVDLGADVCLAFIRHKSKGATGTVDLAEKAGIEVVKEEINPCHVCGVDTPYYTCSTDCTLQALETEDRDDAV